MLLFSYTISPIRIRSPLLLIYFWWVIVRFIDLKLNFLIDLVFKSVYKDRPIPCVLVGTKCDQVEISQNYPLSVEKFAELYRLPPPQFYSSSSAILPNCDIYAKIVAIATYPKMYPMRSQIWRLNLKLYFEKD